MADISAGEIPNLIRGPASTLHLSGEALGAPARALEQTAQAVGEAGGVAEQFAVEKQKANDVAAISDARRQMRVSEAAHQSSLGSEGFEDETKWEGLWNTRSSELNGSILKGQKMSGRARAIIENDLANWTTDGGIRSAGQANKQSISKARAQVILSAEQAIEGGDLETALDELDSMTDQMASDGEVNRLKLKIEKRFDYMEAAKLVTENPKKAVDILEGDDFFTKLSPPSRNSLLGKATQRHQKQQTALYNELVREAKDNDLRNPDDIELMVLTGDLTQGQATAYIRQNHSRNGESFFDTAKYSAVLDRIDEWSPESPNANKEFSKLMGETMKFPSKAGTQLIKRLNDRDDPKSVSNSPVSKQIINEIKRRRDEGNYYLGDAVFGEETFDISNPSHQNRARVAYFDDLTAAAKIIEDNPNMSAGNVWKELNSMPTTQENISSGIKSFATTPEDNALTFKPTSARAQRAAGASAMVRGLNIVYPSITADMTSSQAFEVAKADKGAALTESEKLEILEAFGEFRGLPVEAPKQKKPAAAKNKPKEKLNGFADTAPGIR